jgi:hypothetical protein
VTWTIIVLALLAVVLWGFYVSWRASRLDRLHNRTEAARTALDLALVRRASAAADLASSGQLDPATSLLLADAVRRARQADQADRDLAESDLTRALRATVGDPEYRKELAAADTVSDNGVADNGVADNGVADNGIADNGIADNGIADNGIADNGVADNGVAELIAEVEDAAQRVFIARKFYNDVAGRTIAARRRPLVRVLRLSGSAAQPAFFDMDDQIGAEGGE